MDESTKDPDLRIVEAIAALRDLSAKKQHDRSRGWFAINLVFEAGRVAALEVTDVTLTSAKQ